ncbi:MAG: endolytic transglycosylase MltG [Pseudomonadota bacterium]|nr:endolytic transglycosylase MltG [Pseudomonadota bacterium]
MKRLIIIASSILTFPTIALALITIKFINTPLNFGEAGVTYQIPSGTSFRYVSKSLQSLSVIDSPILFELWGRVTGQAKKIKAGEYLIENDLTPLEIIEKLVNGDVIQYSFTILEGWTVKEMLDALKKVKKLNHNITTEEQIIDSLDMSTENLEGMFFPDTYIFPLGYSDMDILSMSKSLMEEQVNAAWLSRDKDLFLNSPYELLILASIVERESSLESERPDIAAVFLSRLKKGMRLQADPTVIYALGDSFNGDLTRLDLQNSSPYNTYRYKGLPPTPIGLPSFSSLSAAANPSQSEALYFVAIGDGTGMHEFSDTLKDHNDAVARYLKRLKE